MSIHFDRASAEYIDYGTTKPANLYNLLDSFTVLAWAKNDSATPTGGTHDVLTKWRFFSPKDLGWNTYWSSGSGKMRFEVAYSGNTTDSVDVTHTINLNEWFLYAATWEGTGGAGSMGIHLMQGTTIDSNTAATSGTQMENTNDSIKVVAGSQDNLGNHWDGNIGPWMTWGHKTDAVLGALSLDEIKSVGFGHESMVRIRPELQRGGASFFSTAFIEEMSGQGFNAATLNNTPTDDLTNGPPTRNLWARGSIGPAFIPAGAAATSLTLTPPRRTAAMLRQTRM